MAVLYFGERSLDEPIDQVVGLNAESLAPGNLDVRAALIVVRKFEYPFGRKYAGKARPSRRKNEWTHPLVR